MKIFAACAITIGLSAALASGMSLVTQQADTESCGERNLAAEALQKRSAAKVEVTRSLIHGHIDLTEAASQFRQIEGSDSGSTIGYWRMYYPEGSEDEIYCRQVICYVDGELLDRPEEAAVQTSRLETQFVALFHEAH